MSNLLAPNIILIIGMIYLLFHKHFANKIIIISSFAALISFLFGNNFYLPNISIFGTNFSFLEFNKLSWIFSFVYLFVLSFGSLFNFNSKNQIEHFAILFYAFSAISVVNSSNLITFFIFWEMLTIGASILIFIGKDKDSTGAALRYIIFHVIGGVIFLSGILGYYQNFNSFEFTHLAVDNLFSICIFIGIGINCAFPFVHTWVIDSYPKSSLAGVLFLSTFTTKSAVYALIKLFPAEPLLIPIGCVMIVFPIFYAVIENDLRKVLSYSLINQVGFMVVGVGIGTALSINGAVAHVVADIIFKGLLFMSVGAVMYRVGSSKATDLGGLYKYMPITMICCIVGALAISAFPLFSGFVSKSMIISSAGNSHNIILWCILIFGSAGALEHAGIKIPFFTFFGHKSKKEYKEAPICMLISMIVFSIATILIGIFPEYFYSFLPFETDYKPYTFDHVFAQLELLFFAALSFVFLLLAGAYPPEIAALNLDFDFFYRKIFNFFNKSFKAVTNTLNSLFDDILSNNLKNGIVKIFSSFPVFISYPFVLAKNKLTTESKETYSSLNYRIQNGIISTKYSIFAIVIFLIILLYILN